MDPGFRAVTFVPLIRLPLISIPCIVFTRWNELSQIGRAHV